MNTLNEQITQYVKFIYTLNTYSILNDSIPSENVSSKETVPYHRFAIDVDQHLSANNSGILYGKNYITFYYFLNSFYRLLNSKSFKFSKNFIYKSLLNIIRGYVLEKYDNSNEPETELRKSFNNSNNVFYIYIKVYGLSLLNNKPLKMANCEFNKNSLSTVKKMIRYESIKDTEWAKHQLNSKVDNYITNDITCIIAKIIVRAKDYDAAVIIAQSDLYRNVNILNFVAGLYSDFDLHTGKIQFKSLDSHIQEAYGFEIGSSTSKSSISLQQGCVFNLNYLKNKPIILKCFKRLLKIGSNEPSNQYCELMLSSVQWCGKAMWEQQKEVAFLSYVTSLEILLLKKSQSEMSKQLGLIISHLLGKTKKKRIHIFNDMKSLYEIRSKIVHSGEFRVEENDLLLIRMYASSVLVKFLTNKKLQSVLNSKDNLSEYLTGLLL